MSTLSKSLLTVVMALMTVAPARAIPDRAALAAKFKDACDVLLAEERNASGCDLAVLQIVEVAETAAAGSTLPAAAAAKIAEARRLFASTSIVNPDGARLLREAYALVNEGRPFRFPEGLDTVNDVMAYLQKALDGARVSLAAEPSCEAVRAVLEILLIIMTPVASHGGATA